MIKATKKAYDILLNVCAIGTKRGGEYIVVYLTVGLPAASLQNVPPELISPSLVSISPPESDFNQPAAYMVIS